MASRQLHLGAFMRPVGIHTAWWRYSGAYRDANFSFQHLKRFAQTLERGKFDAFFMADHLAVLNMPIQALKRSATVTSFDPFTLLSALAVSPSVSASSPPLRPLSTRPIISPAGSPRSTTSATGAPAGTSSRRPTRTPRSISAWTTTLSTTSAIAAPASSMTSSPGCGTVLPTTRSFATSTRGFISTPSACMSSITRASISRCGGR